MKVKDLINELSKYDKNLEVWIDMFCETGDGYLDGNYNGKLNNIEVFPYGDYPINKVLYLCGDNSHCIDDWNKLREEK